MGPTGVGKSTFINALLDANRMLVGHGLKSCTAQIDAHVMAIPGRQRLSGCRMVIVDTPGFDDTYEEDAEVLRRIAVWLASSYDDGMKLGGVIYLHEISQTRMLGTSRRNLDMFRQLCGEDALAKVILGTTKWGDIREGVGEERERQLSGTYWKEMIDLGSRMERVEKSRESAWSIVNLILNRVEEEMPEGGILHGAEDGDHDNALQIQGELVDLQRLIPETEAGKELRYTLQQLLEMQKKMAAELEAGEGGDHAEARLKETKENIGKTVKQIKDLRVPLPRRILWFFHLT